jgi:hypothetical protein
VIETQVRYRRPRGDEHCYLTVDNYDHADGVFCPQRGSLSCDHQTDAVPARRCVQSGTSQTGTATIARG